MSYDALGMETVAKDIYSFLSVALSMEREDQEVYSTYAEATANVGLRRLLSTMVEMKGEHERRLRELELYEPLPALFLPGSPDGARALDFVAASDLDVAMPRAELLRSAIDRERKAAALYEHLRDRARHEDVRILLSRLCEEEQKLMGWVQDLLDLFELGVG